AGIPLLVGNTEEPAPFSVPQIDGSEILISAPPTYKLGGTKYEFEEWSDGGAISHPILVEGAPKYTASFVEAPPEEEPGTGSGGGGTTTTPPPPGEKEVAAPPETKLGRHPTARSRKTTATFAFSASLAGATFRCKLDGK